MKSGSFIVTFILISFFITNSCQLNLSGDRSSENDSVELIKKKFTGEKKHYWDNGKLKASIQYVDGMREGINKNYSRTGKLISVVPFSNNMINGESKQYYPDGKIHSTINYVNDVKHGVEKWFYENGKLYQKSNYKYGKLHGIQMKYHRNGKVMSEAPYKDGNPGLGLKEYTKDGMLKKQPYIVVTEKDNIDMNGEYIISYRLSDKSINTKFYAGDLDEGKYFSPYLSPIITTNGVGKTVLRVNKGSFVMHTINVIAKKKTHYRNYYIIQKKVNIAVENR